MSKPSYKEGAGDWAPQVPKRSQEKAEELMSTEARDANEVLDATNKLEQWVGGSGKPPGPYGSQGRKF